MKIKKKVLANEKKVTSSAKSMLYMQKRDLVLTITINNIITSKIIVITQESIEELLMIFIIQDLKNQKKLLQKFHDGSKYDYHFIIKELAERFEG